MKAAPPFERGEDPPSPNNVLLKLEILRMQNLQRAIQQYAKALPEIGLAAGAAATKLHPKLPVVGVASAGRGDYATNSLGRNLQSFIDGFIGRLDPSEYMATSTGKFLLVTLAGENCAQFGDVKLNSSSSSLHPATVAFGKGGPIVPLEIVVVDQILPQSPLHQDGLLGPTAKATEALHLELKRRVAITSN